MQLSDWKEEKGKKAAKRIEFEKRKYNKKS